MNQLQPVRFYIIVMVFFLGSLAFGGFYFLNGMETSSYLITDGVNLSRYYIDRQGYTTHFQGLVFSATFLVAGLLMVLVIVLPSHEAAQAVQAGAPPQPRRRGSEGSGGEGGRGGPSTIEWAEAEAGTEAAAAPKEPEVKVVRRSEFKAPMGESSSRDAGGDDDVVYGTGPVTLDSVWEYVQNYPDSAVKFLYRKNLDNKPLSSGDDEIYRKWEKRGLTRNVLREVVLELMGWDALPDDYPHNIWRALRDQIFEMQAK
ncbi:MAG: hypothetical protein OEW39_00290 [Deltaproteobacteria bacterium]|nr:hypothetical protein [Deltaproteobacteria bacterium]